MTTDKARSLLSLEVQRFRSWADKHAPEDDDDEGGWECEYDKWEEMYQAVGRFLSCDLREWTSGDYQTLLYLIARDNDNETIVGRLSGAQLLALAEKAVQLPNCEPAAKCPIMWEMTNHKQDKRVEPLLVSFARDGSAHVRTRALMVLADLGAVGQVEALVPVEWQSEDEFARVSCLQALDAADSKLLDDYLKKAHADGRKYVKEMAAGIESRRANAKR